MLPDLMATLKSKERFLKVQRVCGNVCTPQRENEMEDIYLPASTTRSLAMPSEDGIRWLMVGSPRAKLAMTFAETIIKRTSRGNTPPTPSSAIDGFDEASLIQLLKLAFTLPANAG